jgi:hypothetical protein
MPVPEDAQRQSPLQETVSDFRRALEYAAQMRASGCEDQARVWQQLADFLRVSEDYFFAT